MNESINNQHSGRHHLPLSLDGAPASNNGLRLASIDHSSVAAEGGIGEVAGKNGDGNEHEKVDVPVTWMSLPHKWQLVILTLARLSEPLVQTSLQVGFSAFLFLAPHFSRCAG